ncbi:MULTISPECIES: IS66-like element accessory protein TnpA [unclassified Rhizobium]|uniref:IS66-like element accessory protein TnpA n=1 Tax=unclassified Rhizobium TaxID=2613769 RepID=UPI001C83E050|nr:MULTISPECIES: transposase [unclassified Rhizobium]MBX5165239.1 transposase [Rhizobium sp. NZLR4b]MBX5172819.1 transposase [Rhizobium sp. NZLR1b]MBX5185093.1 transposase [Rhizobium sp. NZLR5]MBX5189211.1 transposase [Rhizobium sp. NZLR3b]MBX5197641.1 transposase [Rhizobium sp. NZLR10]
MTITGLTHSTRADDVVQRFEVFTGAGRRREWSDEEKHQIVAESYGGEVSVSAVARRHGLSPGQLFTWRRQLRKQPEQASSAMFVPAVIDIAAERPSTRRKTIARNTPHLFAIELEIDGAILKIAPGTDAATIAAVIQALKASS